MSPNYGGSFCDMEYKVFRPPRCVALLRRAGGGGVRGARVRAQGLKRSKQGVWRRMFPVHKLYTACTYKCTPAAGLTRRAGQVLRRR